MGRIFQLLTLLAARFLLCNAYELMVKNTVGDEDSTEMDELGKLYHNRTKHNHLSVFRYNVSDGTAIRFYLESDAPRSSPLLAVFREVTNIVSAQLPIVNHYTIYNSTARTLCPVIASDLNNPWHCLSVELSSDVPVNFSFKADIQKNFMVPNDTMPRINLTAGVTSPIYMRYTIPEDRDSVVVVVKSDSTTCMTVSVQPVQCPVFDSESNVISAGLHQTMTTSTAITVERSKMEAFNLVFVVRQDDSGCAEDFIASTFITPSPPEKLRYKNFSVGIEKAPTVNDYLVPIFITTGTIAFIYLIAFAFVIGMGRFERVMMMKERESLMNLLHVDEDQEAGPSYRDDIAEEARELEDDSSLESYDVLPDIYDKEVVRSKIRLTVADLSLKKWKQRDQKYKKYTVSLFTLSLFYGLPVVQLVLNWLNTVRLSGNLDLCWYNFACARPFLIFFDFNNIFSNVGYVSLGLLFILMVMEREHRHKQLVSAFPADLRNDYGLPRHNGLLYAMGMALIMEGLLSASYHICPSNANYQFDTSFMYMIGMLGMLQIYQLRHPDINANAHVAFAIMALFIFVAMGGVYWNYFWYWLIFSIVYVVTMFTVSIEFYFKGMWRFNWFELWRGMKYAFFASKWCSCLIPSYKGRFFFLMAANGINFGYILWGVLNMPRDFPSFLLLPFIANLFLYMLYYIGMKFVYRERLRARAIAYLITSLLCWMGAIWFFLHNVTDWSVTSANSRALNRQCFLLDFYDNHDVWHFLSSLAIFTSFSILLCIDDDLLFVRRDKIMVF
ncbi:unnamed protein product, partial [Mesorhabditis spiculigera]